MLNNENSTVEEVMTSEKEERISSETPYTSTANEMSAQQSGILYQTATAQHF